MRRTKIIWITIAVTIVIGGGLLFVLGTGEDPLTQRATNTPSTPQSSTDSRTSTSEADDSSIAPGYYEMWFSWVNQNPKDAAVWDPSSDSDS